MTAHHCRWEPHRPEFYRYRVANRRVFRPMWNRYDGHWPIGAAVVIGGWSYTVKWARLAY